MPIHFSLHDSSSESSSSSDSDDDWLFAPTPFSILMNDVSKDIYYFAPKILQAERDRLHRINRRKTNSPNPSSAPKRRRRVSLQSEDASSGSSTCSTASTPPRKIVVIGVPLECSVLDLKSRFKIFGSISRARLEPNGIAYINFRSNVSAQAAVDTARNSYLPITLNSVPVQVRWASDPVPDLKNRVGQEDGPSSKLVRAKVPLGIHEQGSLNINRRLHHDRETHHNTDRLHACEALKGHPECQKVMMQKVSNAPVGRVDDLMENSGSTGSKRLKMSNDICRRRMGRYKPKSAQKSATLLKSLMVNISERLATFNRSFPVYLESEKNKLRHKQEKFDNLRSKMVAKSQAPEKVAQARREIVKAQMEAAKANKMDLMMHMSQNVDKLSPDMLSSLEKLKK